MISKFFLIAFAAFFAQSSYASIQNLKDGFIYTTQSIDSCGFFVKTFPADQVASLQWVHNPTSGFACSSGMATEDYKCTGSRCISLQAVVKDPKGSRYRYFVISETGNFYINLITCTPDSNGYATKCENPADGPIYYASTAYQNFGKPTLFKSEIFYIPDNKYAPAMDRNSAILKATLEAEFSCAQFWSTCTRDANLDTFTGSDRNGGRVSIFVRGK